MFRLPEAKTLLTLYGQESREIFSVKPTTENVEQVEDQNKI